jgi:hypothetical protein
MRVKNDFFDRFFPLPPTHRGTQTAEREIRTESEEQAHPKRLVTEITFMV